MRKGRQAKKQHLQNGRCCWGPMEDDYKLRPSRHPNMGVIVFCQMGGVKPKTERNQNAVLAAHATNG